MTNAPPSGGEEELIATYFAPLAGSFAGAEGLKDDCAWLTPEAGSQLVMTVDAVAEGIHFFSDDDPADIGWKALAVNASDLIAKGADPVCYLLSVSFPEKPSHTWLTGLQAGLKEAQTHFGCQLAGGDTDRRPGPITLAVTAIGQRPLGVDLARGNVKPGDHLYVTGTLGDAALGLRIRQESMLTDTRGLTPAHKDHLLQKYLRPKPPLPIIPALRAHAHATMDISDGLAKDTARMARAAGLKLEVNTTRLPQSETLAAVAKEDPEGALFAALTGGDDYEVLAAVPPDNAKDFEQACTMAGLKVTRIGVATQAPADGPVAHFLGADGAVLSLAQPGWDHFDTAKP